MRRTTVGDEPAAIQDAVGAALDRTGAVLTTGGLGPTRDDITKHAVAELLDMPLEFHDDIWQAAARAIPARWVASRRRRNRAQAEVPRGGTVLPNRWGTAPGLWLESARGLVIMLPGVPVEMRNLLAHEVVPRLAPRAGKPRGPLAHGAHHRHRRERARRAAGRHRGRRRAR